MREFEFSSDEADLAEGDTSRRLFSRVVPSVRRDIIGWMGLGRLATMMTTKEEQAKDEVLRDYVIGASLVLDLLPSRSYDFYASDSEAIESDLRASGLDMSSIAEFINQLGQAGSERGKTTRTTIAAE